MPAPQGLDNVVGEVCPRAHQDVDVPCLDEIAHDLSHTGRHHRPGQPEKLRGFRIPQHPLINVDRPCQRTAVVCPGPGELHHQLVHTHPGMEFHLLNRLPALHWYTIRFLKGYNCVPFHQTAGGGPLTSGFAR